jgi:hypothetical protein
MPSKSPQRRDCQGERLAATARAARSVLDWLLSGGHFICGQGLGRKSDQTWLVGLLCGSLEGFLVGNKSQPPALSICPNSFFDKLPSFPRRLALGCRSEVQHRCRDGYGRAGLEKPFHRRRKPWYGLEPPRSVLWQWKLCYVTADELSSSKRFKFLILSSQ